MCMDPKDTSSSMETQKQWSRLFKCTEAIKRFADYSQDAVVVSHHEFSRPPSHFN